MIIIVFMFYESGDLCWVLVLHDQAHMEALYYHNSWHSHYHHGYTLFWQQDRGMAMEETSNLISCYRYPLK